MNIAIDIDDTPTDTFDYFIPFVAEYFGWNESELKKKRISYSDLTPYSPRCSRAYFFGVMPTCFLNWRIKWNSFE